MDVMLELEHDEIATLVAQPHQASLIMGTATTGHLRTPKEVAYSLGALVSGVQTIGFATLERQQEFEESLRRACVTVRTRLIQLRGLGETRSHEA